MSYDILIADTDEAAERLRRQPADVIACVSNHLEHLRHDPIRLSRRAPVPPYRPTEGQIYPFTCRDCDPPVYVVVFFRYGQNETCLEVYAMTFQSLRPPQRQGELFD